MLATKNIKNANAANFTKKILVIDDDINTTRLIDIVFSREGYEIHAVNNSEESLPEALRAKPDLILLDLMMPGVDGIKTCKILQAHPDLQEIPILLFSSAGDIKSKVEAFNAGARDFITKPVHFEELKSRVKVWVNYRESHRKQ
jgi:DNA-binding response OmpR family regulator